VNDIDVLVESESVSKSSMSERYEGKRNCCPGIVAMVLRGCRWYSDGLREKRVGDGRTSSAVSKDSDESLS
jgi:hypothetical protein